MEKNLKTCKMCNETKLHILDKKYDHKNKRFVDENNHQWCGRTCPSCHKSVMKVRMKAMRNVNKNNL